MSHSTSLFVGLISEKKQAKLRSTDPIQQPTTRPTPNSSSKDTDSEIDTADHSTIMPLGSSPTQNSSPSVEVKNEDSVDGHDGRNINSRCEAEQRPKQIPNSSPSIEIKSRDRPQLSDDLDESKSKTELRPNHKLDCSSLKYKCEDIDDVDSRCFQCMDGQEMRELANVKTTFLDFSFLHQNASGNHSECLTILKKVYDYQYSSGEICYLDNMAKGYVGYLFHILECEQEELDCSTWESLGKAFGIQPETEMGEIMRQVWYVLSICASESGEAIIDREKVLKAVRAGNLPSKFKKWMYHGLPYGQITCPVTSELHSRGFKHITWDIKILDKLRGIGPDGKRFPDSETLATKKPFPIGFDPCDVCWNLGNKKCSRCKTRQYCSKFCQLDDWKTHKKICGREETQLN